MHRLMLRRARSAPAVVPSALLVVLVVSALLLGLAPSAPAAAQTNPEHTLCLNMTDLSSFEVSARSTFNRNSTVSWDVNLGCGGMVVKLNGTTVATTGSKTVQPAVTTTYTLTAHVNSLSKVLGSQTVVAGRTVGYWMLYGTLYSAQNFGPAAPVANEQARRTFDALPQANRARLNGKVVEIHVIPQNRKLTDLPDFKHLAGTTTSDGRLASEARGYGATLRDGYRLPLAVGEEEIIPRTRPNDAPFGYFLQHELGHTVLDFATTSWQWATNAANLQARKAAGGPWLGTPSYTQSSVGEYFAEGTAALFRYPADSHPFYVDMYTPNWLTANDLAHYQLLNQVYALR